MREIIRALCLIMSVGAILVFANARSFSVKHPQAASTIPITVVGAFTNAKLTSISGDPHAGGYTVKLWRQGDEIFGLFIAHKGLEGDPPTGILEDIKFDPRAGKLSFDAKLTTGRFFSQKDFNVPSRDLFRFSGILNKKALQGTLEVSNALTPECSSVREKIALRRSARLTQELTAPRSFTEWRAQADEILKLRGPKW